MIKDCNDIKTPELDQEKLQEAYRKTDRLFARTHRKMAMPAIPALPPFCSDQRNAKAALQDQPGEERVDQYLVLCLIILAIFAFALLVVYIDDIYLLFHRV